MLQNAQDVLTLHTYEGSGQAVHPCIIDFLNEYGIIKWSGYRYWMVITPYPNSNDSYENPSIFASEDGVKWIVPEGITNPLVEADGGLEKGFNSDPDMVYNPDDDKLWLYYRFVNKSVIRINLIKINRDRVCEKPITVMEQSPWDQLSNKHRSICVWREASNKWHMWGGGGSRQPPYKIFHFSSEDGVNWDKPLQCLDENNRNPFEELGYYNWHMSCKPNPREKRIEFLCYIEEHKNSVDVLMDKILKKVFRKRIINNNYLMYAEAGMETPALFHLPVKRCILKPSRNKWDNSRLYRASFQIVDVGGNYLYRIWYSAVSKDNIWGMGYTSGHIGTIYSLDN